MYAYMCVFIISKRPLQKYMDTYKTNFRRGENVRNKKEIKSVVSGEVGKH